MLSFSSASLKLIFYSQDEEITERCRDLKLIFCNQDEETTKQELNNNIKLNLRESKCGHQGTY